MPLNPDIDPELLKRALQVSGEDNEQDVLNTALREFVARREQRSICELFKKLEWDDTCDYNTERFRKEHCR